MIERLENRNYFAAVIEGFLFVAGTTGDDVIVFTTSGKNITVTDNGKPEVFKLSDVPNGIRVIAGSGNDRIDASAVALPMNALGGLGNDILIGSRGDDVLSGEAGRDLIVGNRGHDSLSGGDGSDVLRGGDGNDFLQGDTGRDKLDGGKGNDFLAGYTPFRPVIRDDRDNLVGGDGFDTALPNDASDEHKSCESVLKTRAATYPYELVSRQIGYRFTTTDGQTGVRVTVRLPDKSYTVAFGQVKRQGNVLTVTAIGSRKATVGPASPVSKAKSFSLGELESGKYTLKLLSRGKLLIAAKSFTVA